MGDDDVSIEFERNGSGATRIRREGSDEWREVQLEPVGDSGLSLLLIDNMPLELYVERRRGGALVTIGRHTFNCDVGPWRPPSARVKKSAAASGVFKVNAPMTGSIVEVRCAAGDTVAAGDVLIVIESMKMNNELRAPGAGHVETVAVLAGQRVNAGEMLVAVRAEQP
jgi:biotin carboxyl carrier protein